LNTAESSRPELPPKYYLEYFGYLLDFVEKMYGSILAPAEQSFLNQFKALSEDAQCLFIRFSNRRKSFFRVNTLSYEEIDDLLEAINELTHFGFAEDISSTNSHRSEEIINLFNKNELLLLTKRLEPDVMPPKSIKKPDLVRWLLYTYDFSVLSEGIEQLEPVIKVNFEFEVMMMKFLFFGNLDADMTEFVIRDLGHVRFQSFQEENYSIRFSTRKDVDDMLMVSLTKETFYELREMLPPEEIYDWFMNWQGGLTEPVSDVALPAYQSLCIKVATWLERKKLHEQALTAFQLTSKAPSRERRVRLLQKLGSVEEAVALCQEMTAAPQNADERFFAEDFLLKINSNKRRIKRQTTIALQAAEAIGIGIDHRYRVEYGVMMYYHSQGYKAVFSENEPWRALFGLLFWDIIYDTNVQAIHNPLQRVPSDFFLPDFYSKRRPLLLTRIEELQSKEALRQIILTTFQDKLGTTNVLVSWYDGMLETVLTIIDLLEPKQLHQVLLEMAGNLRENTRGFPDLLVWNDHEYAFIEVKSPTDHLSSQQLHWQRFLSELQINTKVLRVNWLSDPINDENLATE
jgi:hypothetical protein